MTDAFHKEMLRWAEEHGSTRLRVGIEDGYRMIGVYLQERIEREVGEGFYAWRPESGQPCKWGPRNGPTEEALLLRREVQARVAQVTDESAPIPEVEIVWLTEAPEQMCSDDDREWDDCPCEAIIIPGWLGRYTLLGVVVTDENPATNIDHAYALVAARG